MAGQLWSVPAEGGYLYSDQLSKYLRMAAQPRTKFRQFADAKDATQKGLHAGDKFNWNTFTALATQGRRLSETQPIPETGFTIQQKTMTIFEGGNSVPYTGKLQLLGQQDVEQIIEVTLLDDFRKFMDIEVFNQFNLTPLRVAPTGGNSTTSVTLSTNGVTGIVNNVALGTGHTKAISDIMKERNIPAFFMDDYMVLTHPSTLRTYKNQLEAIKVYTETGMTHIFNGEVGRYESCRHVEQNFIPKGGANDSTLFDPYTSTADPWDNGQSSWAFYFGADTVTEAVVVPEEIRAKIPGDYGRSRGIAWYYLGGFGLVHDDAQDARIVKWDSAS